MASPAPKAPSLLRESLHALLVALIFAVFARTWVVQAFKIPTGSMEENLLVGDHILVNKFVYGPAVADFERRWLPERPVGRGDVVVFKYPEDPGRDFIKRCLGLPGDRVELIERTLYLNGEALDESAYAHLEGPTGYPNSPFVDDYFRTRDNFGPYTVPDGHYFCLGDNRDNSNDSRFWGPVPASYVKGRALLVYFSSSAEESPPAGWGRFAARLGEASAVRWGRLFRLVK